jgi:hypothetical protein
MTSIRATVPTIHRQRRIWAQLERSRRRWRRPRVVHCAVCGMRVLPDDAIGLVRAGVTHAECALVQMLERETTAPTGPTIDQNLTDARWRILIQALTGAQR